MPALALCWLVFHLNPVLISYPLLSDNFLLDYYYGHNSTLTVVYAPTAFPYQLQTGAARACPMRTPLCLRCNCSLCSPSWFPRNERQLQPCHARVCGGV